MSDCEEGLTEYLKGVWLKIRPGLSVMLGIIILMNLLYVMIVLLKHWKMIDKGDCSYLVPFPRLC